nr:hypothetical protein CFP56_24031 [Quercus suber]
MPIVREGERVNYGVEADGQHCCGNTERDDAQSWEEALASKKQHCSRDPDLRDFSVEQVEHLGYMKSSDVVGLVAEDNRAVDEDESCKGSDESEVGRECAEQFKDSSRLSRSLQGAGYN